MEKFGRRYKIVFRLGRLLQLGAYDKAIIDDELTIEYPLTVDLAVTRGVYSQTNTAFVNIYGLAQITRERLLKDRNDTTNYIEMKIYAGYEDFLHLIFNGTIKECQSYKESGATEYITEIEAWDGGLAVLKGSDNNSFGANTKYETILETLCQNIPNIRIGAMSPDYKEKTQVRPYYAGMKTMDDLSDLTNGNMFIDNEEIFFINTKKEVIEGDLAYINTDAGLLGSPRRREGNVTLDIVFEPRITVGQRIVLQSQTVPYLNGVYKVLGVNHEGTISGAKCGSMITTLDLFIGTELFRMVQRR